MHPRSLRNQLLIRSLFVLSGLLILIGGFQYVLMSHFLYRNTAESIDGQIRSLPPQVWLSIGDQRFSRGPGYPQFFSFAMPGSTVAFIDQKGNFYQLSKSFDQHIAPHLPVQEYQAVMTYRRQGYGHYQIVNDSRGMRDLVVLAPVGPPDNPRGVVQVTTDVRPLTRVLMEQLITFIGLGLLALGIGLVTFLRTVNRTLVPLTGMIRTVGRINAGNLHERFAPEQSQSEIELLSRSFNAMLERLDKSFESERVANEKMRQFISDASHELRTPLTSIRGFLEVLLRGAADHPEQLHKALQTMHGESERMSKLVEDLLLLARFDKEPTLDLTEGRLDSLVRDMEPQLGLLAGERHVNFALETDQVTRFDADKIKQAILNLFQNAIQHTDPKDGHIDVAVRGDETGVEILVQDNGTGIKPEHMEGLFERFYRVDTARSRKDGGAGLGLAITRSIVDAHAGTITCESEAGLGTVFRIWLPIRGEGDPGLRP